MKLKHTILALSVLYVIACTATYSANTVHIKVYDHEGYPVEGLLVMLQQYVLDPVTGTEETDTSYEAYSDDSGSVLFQDIERGLYYAAGVDIKRRYEPVSGLYIDAQNEHAEIEIHEIEVATLDLHVRITGESELVGKVSALTVGLMNGYDIYKMNNPWDTLMNNHEVRNGRGVIRDVVPSKYRLHLLDDADVPLAYINVSISQNEANVIEQGFYRKEEAFDLDIEIKEAMVPQSGANRD